MAALSRDPLVRRFPVVDTAEELIKLKNISMTVQYCQILSIENMNVY